MKIIKPQHTSIKYLTYNEVTDLVVILVTNIVVFFMVEYEIFLKSQVIVIPIFFYYLLATHKKQVVEILIDEGSQKVTFKINRLIFWNSYLTFNFDELTLFRKDQLLFKSYLKVIQINAKTRKLAVIPYKQSIWSNSELDELYSILSNYIVTETRS